MELHRYSEASDSWVSVGNEKRIEAYEWQTAFTDVPDFGNVYRIRALNGLDGRNLILNQDDSDRDNGAPAVFHVTSVDDPAVIVTFDNVVYSVGADITTVSLSYQRLYANFSVEKVWDDAKASGVRPASLSVRLECRDAQDRHWTEKATISLSEANGWRADFPAVELNKEHFNLLFRAVELDESGEPVGSGSIAALKYDPFGGDVQPLAPNEEGEAAENAIRSATPWTTRAKPSSPTPPQITTWSSWTGSTESSAIMLFLNRSRLSFSIGKKFTRPPVTRSLSEIVLISR